MAGVEDTESKSNIGARVIAFLNSGAGGAGAGGGAGGSILDDFSVPKIKGNYKVRGGFVEQKGISIAVRCYYCCCCCC